MKLTTSICVLLGMSSTCLGNQPNALLLQKKIDTRPFPDHSCHPDKVKKNPSDDVIAAVSPFQASPQQPQHSMEEGRESGMSMDNQIASDKVLASDTKAVILLGATEDLNKADGHSAHGVEIYNLTVPGNPEDLKKLLEPVFLGKPLTLNLIAEIKKTILQYYIDHNNPIILIEVPEQDITHGILQLVVHQGKLGEVTFKGNKYFTSEDLQKYINLEKGNAIDYDVLMSDMQWLNRSPFHHSTLYVTPGLFPGTTNVEFATTDRRPVNVYVGADNTGNRFTGFERFYAGFTATRFFKLNHILNYQFTGSNKWSRFQAHVVNYTIPLPWRHILLLVAGYEKNVPKIRDFRAKSNSLRTQAQYIIPLASTSRKLFHEVAVQLDFEDDLYKLDFLSGGTSTSLQNTRAVKTDVALAYNGRWDSAPHRLLFSGQVYYSPGKWLPHQSNETYQKLRPYAKNHYVFTDLYFEYDYQFPYDILAAQQLKGQLSSTNLIFNTYTIADYYSVRGYKDYFNKDNAFIYDLDLMTPALNFGGHKDGMLRGLVFFNYGIGSNHTLFDGEKRSEYAMSVGPGIRFNWDPYGWLRLDYGFPLHKLPDSPQGRHSWLQFGAFFNF